METKKTKKSKKQNPSEWGSVPSSPKAPQPGRVPGHTHLRAAHGNSSPFHGSQDWEEAKSCAPSPGARTPHGPHHGCLRAATVQRETSFSSDQRISTLEQASREVGKLSLRCAQRRKHSASCTQGTERGSGGAGEQGERKRSALGREPSPCPEAFCNCLQQATRQAFRNTCDT